MDISSLFDQDKFSDVVLAYSGREKKCHKLVLCQTSPYFDKLCGPDADFAEKDQNRIELKDDDPDALDAMIRFIYTFKYMDPAVEASKDWKFHANVAMAGDKYQIPKLKDKAVEALCEALQQISDKGDAAEIVLMIQELEKFYHVDKELESIRAKMCEANLSALLENEDFDALLYEDGSLSPSLVKLLAAGQKGVLKEEIVLWTCQPCQRSWSLPKTACARFSVMCRNCQQHTTNGKGYRAIE